MSIGLNHNGPETSAQFEAWRDGCARSFKLILRNVVAHIWPMPEMIVQPAFCVEWWHSGGLTPVLKELSHKLAAPLPHVSQGWTESIIPCSMWAGEVLRLVRDVTQPQTDILTHAGLRLLLATSLACRHSIKQAWSSRAFRESAEIRTSILGNSGYELIGDRTVVGVMAGNL